MTNLFLGVAAATLFWFVIFGLEAFHFWYSMSAASSILAFWSLFAMRESRSKLFHFKSSHLLWGVLSALTLYAIFWVGDQISVKYLPFAEGQIASIYARKGQLSQAVVTLLLFFLIGPAEEIFWRGMIQRLLAHRYGSTAGWLIASIIYGLVHLWSVNFMLLAAAITASLFWGWAYKRSQNLWPVVISHALWDVLIFVIAPI